MNLSLSDRDFCLFLLAQFSFAVDDDKEITLLDYLDEHFDMPSGEWLSELTGQGESDAWDGYTYAHHINETTVFYAEFHPDETVYFFNDLYLGNGGGHPRLSLLTWTEMKSIAANRDEEDDLLLLMMMPLVIGRASESAEIHSELDRLLRRTSLDLDDEKLEDIARFLARHLIFSDDEKNIVRMDERLGLVTNRDHSERSAKGDVESLLRINAAIELAIAPK